MKEHWSLDPSTIVRHLLMLVVTLCEFDGCFLMKFSALMPATSLDTSSPKLSVQMLAKSLEVVLRQELR